MELEVSRQIFEKKAEILNFIEVHPMGVKLFHARTDGQDEANSRFSQSCERA